MHGVHQESPRTLHLNPAWLVYQYLKQPHFFSPAVPAQPSASVDMQ